MNNIYFRLRLVLADTLNTYLRFKICAVEGIYNPKCILIEFYTKSDLSDILKLACKTIYF